MRVRTVQVSQTVEEFARGVQQLCVLEDEGLLLTLVDERLTLHTLPELGLASSAGAAAVSRSKGVKCATLLSCTPASPS